MKYLLIDGDSLLYQAALGSEYTLFTLSKDGEVIEVKGIRKCKQNQADGWEVVKETPVLEPVHFAKHTLKMLIHGIVDDTDPQSVELYLTPPSTETFRHKLYVMYKANRKAPKPKHFMALYEYASTVFNAIDKPGLEADDLVSIRAHQLDDEGIDYIIAHIDKDLDMIPGRHYNFRTSSEYFIPPIEAELNFYMQLLTGDTADNIPGITGVGPKKAEKILADADTDGEMWMAVVKAYSELAPDISIEDILKRGRLLRLLEKEGEYWSPLVA